MDVSNHKTAIINLLIFFVLNNINKMFIINNY